MFKKKIIGGVYVSVSKIKKISSKLPDNQLRYSIGFTFSETAFEEWKGIFPIDYSKMRVVHY